MKQMQYPLAGYQQLYQGKPARLRQLSRVELAAPVLIFPT